MSIATAIASAQSKVADAYTACNSKGATMPAAGNQNLSNLATTISSITTGGGGSTNEISLPAWVKDGDTHLWINIRNTYQLDQQLRIRMIGTIDWGDGTAAQSVSVTTYTTFTHTYAAPGKYRIDLHPTSGTFYLGGGNTTYNVMGTRAARQTAIQALYQAEVGSGRITQISSYAFYYCYGLQRLYIPDTIVTLSSYCFGFCYSLHQVEFQDSSTITNSTLTNTFYYCTTLPEVAFAPESVTTLNGVLRYAYCIPEFTIPATVTSIGSYAFSNASGLKVLYCLPTTPPTIATATAFEPPAACVIKVPKGSLSSYQAGTTWSDYASQMEEASLITFTLTSVSSSNKARMVDLNESYTTTLVPDTGKTLGTVTVKMGGTDITSTAYSAGVVTIASVTGNIEITASAS